MITVLTNPLSPPSTPDEKNFPKRKGIRMKLQAALQNWISKNPTNNKKIDIPGWEFRAPNKFFAETDKAFENLIARNKYKILEMQTEYYVNWDKETYARKIFELACKEMHIDNVKINPINEPTIEESWSFWEREREVTINIAHNTDIIETVFHELNHFLQFKEQLLTEHGVEIYSQNEAQQIIEKEGITSPEARDIKLKQYKEEGIRHYTQLYSDILAWTKYPKNKPWDIYSQKANTYHQDDIHYINDKKNHKWYRNKPKEIESRRRGELCSNFPEKVAIDLIYRTLKETKKWDTLSTEDKKDLMNFAIEDLQDPQHQNDTIDQFLNYFLWEYNISYEIIYCKYWITQEEISTLSPNQKEDLLSIYHLPSRFSKNLNTKHIM